MIKIIYGDVARGAAEGATYTDTGKQTYADLLLSDGANPRLIATGEIGRWKLDGSVDLLGAVSSQYGYVSTEISGADGAYTGEVGVNIALDGNYASTGLTITFDTLEDVTYSFRVEWYNGETKVAEGTFSGKGETTAEQTVPLYNAVRIRFLSSDKPYRFARLQKILFGVGREFTPSDFDTISLTQEVSPISDDRHKQIRPSPAQGDPLPVSDAADLQDLQRCGSDRRPLCQKRANHRGKPLFS